MTPDNQGNGGALVDQPDIRELLTKPTADLSEEERRQKDLLRQVLSSIEGTRSDLITGQERIEDKIDPEELGANLARELASQATQQSEQEPADRSERVQRETAIVGGQNEQSVTEDRAEEIEESLSQVQHSIEEVHSDVDQFSQLLEQLRTKTGEVDQEINQIKSVNERHNQRISETQAVVEDLQIYSQELENNKERQTVILNLVYILVGLAGFTVAAGTWLIPLSSVSPGFQAASTLVVLAITVGLIGSGITGIYSENDRRSI